MTRRNIHGAGITDTSARMWHIVALVKQLLPGVYVRALEVTGSSAGSVFNGMDTQVSAHTQPVMRAR